MAWTHYQLNSFLSNTNNIKLRVVALQGARGKSAIIGMPSTYTSTQISDERRTTVEVVVQTRYGVRSHPAEAEDCKESSGDLKRRHLLALR